MSFFHLLASDLDKFNIDDSKGNTLTLTKSTLKSFVADNKEVLRMLGSDVQKAFITLYKHVSDNEGQYRIDLQSYWPQGKKGYHTVGRLKFKGSLNGDFDIFEFKKVGGQNVERRISKMETSTTPEQNAMSQLIFVLSGYEAINSTPRANVPQAKDFLRNHPWIA